MTVYISGKITGSKNYMRKFARAERKLKRAGYDVINPAKNNKVMPKNAGWEDYMLVCLAELKCADAIYMLNDWTDSRGAKVELNLAKQKNKTIMYEEQEC